MARGFCEDCQSTQEITPKGLIKEGWTARWWQLVVHKHPKEQRLCDGSGKQI